MVLDNTEGCATKNSRSLYTMYLHSVVDISPGSENFVQTSSEDVTCVTV